MTKKLLIMAGGTGGHIFPGLAVAHQLMTQGWQVEWLGKSDKMEAELVPKQGIKIHFIEISAIRGQSLLSKLVVPFRILRAVMQARKIIKTFQPDVVLGMGGYVSGPGGIAAKLCGVPIVLHEQNGIAGLTNKWIAKIATTVLQAFPSAFKGAKVVGNPVRGELLSLPKPEVRLSEREGAIRVLVMGGSQGAAVLNRNVPLSMASYAEKFVVWHQTGKGQARKVTELYNANGMSENQVTEFIDDVAEAYCWADLVICRSGAMTVSEIEAVGVAAIFVPFKHKDRQQYWNAKHLQDINAAKIIEQDDCQPDILAKVLGELDRKQLLDMAIKVRTFAKVEATKEVAKAINDAVDH